jgi:hypothetical protein
MTDYYCDFNTGSDANGGTSWADAKKTWENLIALVSSESHRGFYRESGVVDTAAANRDISCGGAIYGVKAGTTNEPPQPSDFCVKGTDTLPIIETTGTGSLSWRTARGIQGMHFRVAGTWTSLNFSFTTQATYLRGCIIDAGASGNMRITPTAGSILSLIDCDLVGASLWCYEPGVFEMIGGSVVTTNSAYVIFNDDDEGEATFVGVDFSGVTADNIFSGGTNGVGRKRLYGCKMKGGPSGWAPVQTALNNPGHIIEFIGCSDDTGAKAADSSLQDLAIHTEAGTVENEATAVRTGGADDGASGAFSYAMTPAVSKTAPHGIPLTSPWIKRWVDGGTSELTVHIANSGAGDYTREEAFAEFLTVAADDSPQLDHQFEDGGAAQALAPNTTVIADDATSVWGTGAGNAQKFVHSVTPGFTGWALVRVHFTKSFISSPETLYLDPYIAVA